MKELLEQIFSQGYTQYKGKGNKQSGSNEKKRFFNLEKLLVPKVLLDNLAVEASVGKGRWSTVPFVRIFDRTIAPSAKSGVYIVYLFNDKGDSVFLTLNQGVEDSTEESRNITRKKIQTLYDTEHFQKNEGLVDGLGDYAGATIYFKEYKKSKIPSEAELEEDLRLMVDLYKNILNRKKQIVFFGAPGTGKSYRVEDSENGYGLKNVRKENKFRTTFHPDYDYAQFVGAYKPKEEKGGITYSFVPQVFAKAYSRAWEQWINQNDVKNNPDYRVFLVIEEINRGNCAQIFGDVFQLLDRNDDGFSEYSIDIDNDFAEWLRKEGLKKNWNKYIKFSYKKDGKDVRPVSEKSIALPPNLNIIATMNTSDQSLFPMDSAFKRRFDWEYVPINYDQPKADFEIKIDDSKKYRWLDFLEKVNADIDDTLHSEDKQMGEFFIKPKDGKTISFEDFRSKVLFYLWDSVYKDETERQTVFHFAYENGNDKIKSVTFQSLFGKNDKEIVKKIMENLGVKED